MSWVRILVHLVFTTKDRTPFLDTSLLRQEVFTHIKQNATQKGILLDCVNGHSEHAHCLIALTKDQSISHIAQLNKGELSFWINKNKLTAIKFAWQDDYWAVSVGENQVQVLRHYIHTQEEHHRKKSFDDELYEILHKYESNPLQLAKVKIT